MLLGRGTGPNEHEGNVRFRSLAAEILRSSLEDSNKTPEAKTSKRKLAKKVVEAVEEKGGKFVRKLTRDDIVSLGDKLSGGDISLKSAKNKDLYVEVPFEVALDKAKQSFRPPNQMQTTL